MAKKESESNSELKKLAWHKDISKEEIKTFIEKEKQSFTKMPEISIMISSYNDIFSSFDPRPTPQRALSDDFLIELKKASQVKDSDDLEIKILAPAKIRNVPEENIIKKRLKEHFIKHEEIEKKEKYSIIRNGIISVFFGVVLMFLATLVLFKFTDATIWSSFLVILLEPAGWFLFWEGLSQIIFDAKKKHPNVQFYKRMTKSKISFDSY